MREALIRPVEFAPERGSGMQMVTELIRYKVGDHVLTLETSPNVFHPNSTSRFLVESIEDARGQVVLDLGCGVGPISISAALMGAERVYAVDIMPEACELARRNVERNGVADRVTVLEGNLFDALREISFDIVVDDVSGVADEVARMSSWYPEPVPTGGPDGTLPTLNMLTESRSHLRNGGYLVFPVLSLSASEKIVAAARDIYGQKLQLLSSRKIPFNKQLQDNIDRLFELRDLNMIDFEQNRSRYLWTLDIYRAKAR